MNELGEGSIAFEDFLFSTWNAISIIENNVSYKIQHYLSNDFIAIGTDGGDICFLLDYRENEEAQFSCVGLGDLDIDEVIILAETFEEGLKSMIEKKITLESLL